MKAAKLINKLAHHAYCLIGGAGEHEALKSELETHKIKTSGNPDFTDRVYETFTIDNARELKSLAETRPVSGSGKKIFVIEANGVTVEAQNALLKLLEEPPSYAHFFLILPSAHLLLPTVKSRLSFLGDAGKKASSSNELLSEAQKFLKLSQKDRLESVKKLMDDISKEKKSKQDAVDLLGALEETLHERGVRENRHSLEAVMTARKYSGDRAPSLKMLLEYVALEI